MYKKSVLKFLLTCIFILTNFGCVSLTKIDDANVKEVHFSEPNKIKNLNIYFDFKQFACLPQKEFENITENINNFFKVSDDEQISYIRYSKWDVNYFLYGLNYLVFVSSSGIIPLYTADETTSKIIITNKNMESRVYQSKFSEEALFGLLLLPFMISGSSIQEVHEAKIRASIQRASLLKPEIEYFVPISDDFKLKSCEEKNAAEEK